MEILISGQDLSKTYGARALFKGISFAIEEKERIGLIGPNGAGKSTLLKILTTEVSPDTGKISKKKGLRIGYLAQTPEFEPNATVFETILEGTTHDEDWQAQALAHELISKLSLTDGPVDTLSGGWKKRVALARELAKRPDLLLLDEPTNHLDVESILWLEDFMANSPFTTLTITHDRLFLQKIANRILELDPRNENGLLSVRGDYTTYLEVKEQLLSAQYRREVILKNTLRRETEWLRRGAKARTTKQVARIKRAENLKEEVGGLQTRNQSNTAKFDFQGAEKNPKRLVEAKHITKSLGGKTLFKDLTLTLSPGSRIGLLGPNGCGKSTLIRVLLGDETPDAGSVERSDSLSIAYFEQNREILDPELTVAETLCPRGDHVKYRDGFMHIRSYLDRFLFTQEQMDMRVRNLSGGEQSRLLIAQLMLTPANLLVLDEPTNDLDMVTLTVLEDCLKDFAGAIVLVTHDRYFLDQVATQILSFSKTGRIHGFHGIEQWENWMKEEAIEEKRALSESSSSKNPSTARKRKLSFNEQREFDGMEANIHKAEAELELLMKESQSPEVSTHAIRLAEISKAMGKLQREIERLYSRWSELEKMQNEG